MTRIEAIWQSIREEAAESQVLEGESTLVRIDPHHPFDIYGGVDGGGSVMLAIGVTMRPPVIDADTGALTYIKLQRPGGRWLMGLRLAGTGLEQVFGRLCQDLIDAAVNVATEAALVSLFRERLLLWKRLFRDGSSGLLQKFQIKGLVAELLVLEHFILAHRKDPLLPVVSWIGPSGADQDFMFSDRAIEVKAISPGIEMVNIASAEQLEAEVPLSLYVCVLREASSKEIGALSLPIVVSRIEHILSDVPDALRTFRGKLLEAGYVEHDHYQGIAYTPMGAKNYAVRDGFPRLVRARLPAGIPNVTYSILLSSIAAFQISENLDAA
jgi:hypothetical protein